MSKPRGPKPFTPTSAERTRVEVAVAMGMTIEQISDALEMPRRSFCRAFKRELSIGRNRKRLDVAMQLYQAACSGNVAACKALMVLFNDAKTAEPASRWDGFAERYWEQVEKEKLARNQDFH